jgi:hypothetical protein
VGPAHPLCGEFLKSRGLNAASGFVPARVVDSQGNIAGDRPKQNLRFSNSAQTVRVGNVPSAKEKHPSQTVPPLEPPDLP